MPDLTPICLLVDDGCPLIHVYRYHWEDVHHKPPVTDDGRPLLDTIPNSFLDHFCDVMEARKIKGKLSIVPAPAGKGDIVRGIEGFDPSLTHDWLRTVQRRLSGQCDFCPEGITHNLALNLENKGFHAESESEWSQHQTRETLTPYLVRQLQLLKEAGFNATGITSPWAFGIMVEPEYIAAIVAAQKAVYNREFSWYFLHMLYDKPATRPWVAHKQGRSILVSIPATVQDWWWETINCSRTDTDYVSTAADKMLTADGQKGQIIDVLEAGGWPVILTHWQSLFSNGLETGLMVLDELGRRVSMRLADRVEWTTCYRIAILTAGLRRSPAFSKRQISSPPLLQQGEEMVLDVVCKMEIDEKTAKWKSDYKGKTYYFCAPMCKQKFDRNPEKYIR